MYDSASNDMRQEAAFHGNRKTTPPRGYGIQREILKRVCHLIDDKPSVLRLPPVEQGAQVAAYIIKRVWFLNKIILAEILQFQACFTGKVAA
jgi:hypothetical protein